MCRRRCARTLCGSRPGASWRRRMSETSDDAVPETIATYLRLRGLEPSARSFRRKKRRRNDDEHEPFTAGRDPRGLGDVLATMTREAGWDSQLAREDVV